MSLHIGKLFTHPLALASAALVFHIGAATAADATGDIQQQVRELLTGTPTAHFATQSGARDGKVTTTSVDSQEFVKQLLLGTAASRGAGAETIKRSELAGASGKTEPQKRPVAYSDTQAAVRQALLRQPLTSEAARPAARPTR